MNAHASAISESAAMSAEVRVAGYDWQAIRGELDNYGCAVLPELLSRDECRTIAALYPAIGSFFPFTYFVASSAASLLLLSSKPSMITNSPFTET